MKQSLSDLLSALPFEFVVPENNPEVSAPVTENAREIEPGGVFLARKGRLTDGHDYIEQAVENGAVAVVGELPFEDVEARLNGIAYAQVPDGYQAFGYLASAYEGYPSLHLVVIGVTGTNGKTTTATIIYEILKKAGVPVGMISTVSAVIGNEEISTGLHVTSPHAHELQKYLRMMVEAGMTHVVLETTSMGLEQGRVNGTFVDVAVMTNVTHEHLDWHGSFENYRDAKARLFTIMKETARKSDQPNIAVVNADDPSAEAFAEASIGGDYLLLYSTQNPNADFYADRIHYAEDFTSFMLRGNAGDIPIRSTLPGEYNVSNILAGIAGAISALPQLKHQQRVLQSIPQAIADLPQIPGRMERIDEGQDFIAIVDFAHTPDALERALLAAQKIVPENGRVISIFGSAGLRDKEKRRMMAEVSAELADISVLTAEDPRTESLLGILAEMKVGAESKGATEGENLFLVPDRGKAIYEACQMAKPEDVVIVYGKGHEQSMCFGTVEHPWDDRDAMRAALQGNPLTTLPSAGDVYDEAEPWLAD